MEHDLTKEDMLNILSLWDLGYPKVKIAKMFDVTPHLVEQIGKGILRNAK
jgi:hypothetical protein